jgi:hypothetical protein
MSSDDEVCIDYAAVVFSQHYLHNHEWYRRLEDQISWIYSNDDDTDDDDNDDVDDDDDSDDKYHN